MACEHSLARCPVPVHFRHGYWHDHSMWSAVPQWPQYIILVSLNRLSVCCGCYCIGAIILNGVCWVINVGCAIGCGIIDICGNESISTNSTLSCSQFCYWGRVWVWCLALQPCDSGSSLYEFNSLRTSSENEGRQRRSIYGIQTRFWMPRKTLNCISLWHKGIERSQILCRWRYMNSSSPDNVLHLNCFSHLQSLSFELICEMVSQLSWVLPTTHQLINFTLWHVKWWSIWRVWWDAIRHPDIFHVDD